MYAFGKKKKKKDRRSFGFGFLEDLSLNRGGRARDSQSFGMGSRFSVSHLFERPLDYFARPNWLSVPRHKFPDGYTYYKFGEAGWWRLEDGHAIPLQTEGAQAALLLRRFIGQLDTPLRAQIDTPMQRELLPLAVGAGIANVGGNGPFTDEFYRQLSRRHIVGNRPADSIQFLEQVQSGARLGTEFNIASDNPVEDHFVVSRQIKSAQDIHSESVRQYNELHYDQRVLDIGPHVELSDLQQHLLSQFRSVSENKLTPHIGLMSKTIYRPSDGFESYDMPSWPGDSFKDRVFRLVSACYLEHAYSDPSQIFSQQLVSIDGDEYFTTEIPVYRKDIRHVVWEPLSPSVAENRRPIDFISIRGTRDLVDVLDDAKLAMGMNIRRDEIGALDNYLAAVRSVRYGQGGKIVASGHSLGAYTLESLASTAFDKGYSFAPYHGARKIRHPNVQRIKSHRDVFSNVEAEGRKGDILFDMTVDSPIGILEAHSVNHLIGRLYDGVEHDEESFAYDESYMNSRKSLRYRSLPSASAVADVPLKRSSERLAAKTSADFRSVDAASSVSKGRLDAAKTKSALEVSSARRAAKRPNASADFGSVDAASSATKARLDSLVGVSTPTKRSKSDVSISDDPLPLLVPPPVPAFGLDAMARQFKADLRQREAYVKASTSSSSSSSSSASAVPDYLRKKP